MKYILSVIILFASLNTQALTRLEFVERLKNTHPFFNQQALSTQIRHIEKRATTANKDWTLAVNADYEKNNTPFTALNTARNSSIKLSASKKIVDLGADLVFSHALTDKNQNQNQGFNTARNQFLLNYTHPLLRNKNGINDLLNTDIAQIAIEQNVLERLEQEENFILQNLQRFINLAYAQERQRINEQRLTLAGQELALVRQKFASSVVDKVDVLLQEDAYQSAEQQSLMAQQELLTLRYEVAIILNIEPEDAIAKIDIYQAKKLPDYDKNQLLSLFANARVLAITKLNQKNFKRQLLSFKNKNLLKLDLNLGISNASNNADYASLSAQDPSWNIGLDLSYPLGNTRSRSDISKVKIQLDRLEQRKYEQRLDLQTQIAALTVQINLLVKTLVSNKKQIDIAKERSIEEKNRYRNGNGDASFVINAQNNEQSVQLSYAQVAKNYQTALLEYQATIDKLLP